MDSYASLLGLNDPSVDALQANTLVVQKDLTVFGNSTLSSLTLPTGAALNKVLTSDLQGNATWQTQQEQVLSGDAVGPASSNRIDKLAGGTIPVPSLVTLAALQTLTNKTLTLPIVAQISNSGILTLPTGTDTLVGSATVDILINKTIIGPTNLVEANSIRNTGTWVVPFSGAAPVTSNILTFDGLNAVWSPVGNLTGDITSSGLVTTLQNLSGDITSVGRVTTAGATIVKTTVAQTLTNKTVTGTTNSVDANTIRNGSTWATAFAGSAPASSNVLTYNGTNAVWAAPSAGNLTGDITSVGLATTLGNLSGDITSVGRVTTAGANIVTLAGTQTLTNKTLGNVTIRGSSQQLYICPTTSNNEASIAFNTASSGGAQWTMGQGSYSVGAGNFGIGYGSLALKIDSSSLTMTIPNNIYMNNNSQNKMISLYDSGTYTNKTQLNFIGFGISGTEFTYNVNVTTNDHVFYAATSSTARNELFRIKGTGAISCAGNISSGGLITGGILSTGITSSGTISTPVLNATNGFITPANGQGTYIGWNKSSGSAETNFVNNTPFGSGGSGTGGWEFATRTTDGVYGVKMTVDGSSGLLTVPSISCSGNVTAGAFTLSGGGNAMSYFEEYSQTYNFSGPPGSFNATCYIVRMNKCVTITVMPSSHILLSSTAGLFTSTSGLPARFCPSSSLSPATSTAQVYESVISGYVVALVFVLNTGVMTVQHPTNASGNFPTGGGLTLYQFSMSYTIL